MKRLAGIALAIGMAACTGAAAATWEMPTPYPEAEFHTKNIRAFIADVEKATNGELKINLHSGQALYKHPEIYRAVQTGQVPIAEMLMSNLLNQDPIFGADAVPFLASSYEEADRLWAAQKPFVEKRLAKDGLMLLYVVPWPGQGIYAKRPIESVEGLKGVKFRTYNASTARMAELMGAIPTIVEAVEIPQAFSTGIVDAMVTSAATGVRTKAWDFSEYFYDLRAWLPKNMVFVSQRYFRQLPEEQRKAVLDAAKAAEARGAKMSREASDEGAADLAKGGMTVSPGSAELKQGLQEIGAQLTEEWAKSAGEDGAALLEAYRK